MAPSFGDMMKSKRLASSFTRSGEMTVRRLKKSALTSLTSFQTRRRVSACMLWYIQNDALESGGYIHMCDRSVVSHLHGYAGCLTKKSRFNAKNFYTPKVIIHRVQEWKLRIRRQNQVRDGERADPYCVTRAEGRLTRGRNNFRRSGISSATKHILSCKFQNWKYNTKVNRCAR